MKNKGTDISKEFEEMLLKLTEEERIEVHKLIISLLKQQESGQ